MNTSYKKNIPSPFQFRNRPYNIENNMAVRDEIKKNICTLNLTAEFTEDVQTLQAFKHIPGVIAFLCVLKKDGQVIGFGRGMSVVTQANRYLNRVVNFSQNAALIDSVVRATKMLDALHLNNNQQSTDVVSRDTYETKEVEGFIPITDRQMKFLSKLLQSNAASEKELSQVEFLSKNEAREKINLLVTVGENKIDY